MENASQALIMAGGILIAIVLISLAVYVYVSFHNVSSMEDQKVETEQLVAFNKKYEAYNKSLMHGSDLATLMNMASADNEKYGINIQISFTIAKTDVFKIHTELKPDGSTAISRETDATKTFADTYSMGTYETNIKYVKGDPSTDGNKVIFDDFKRRVFTCTDVTYDNNTGRISSMQFMESELTNDGYTHK